MLRKPYHRYAEVLIYGTGCFYKVKGCPNDICIISIGFKEIAHLIQDKAIRIVCLDFKIILIELRQMTFLRHFTFCLRYEGIHRIFASANAFRMWGSIFFQYGIVFRCAEVNQLRLGVFIKVFKEAVRTVGIRLCFGYKVIGQMCKHKLTARCCVGVIIDRFKFTNIGTVEIVVIITDRCCVRIGVRFLPFRRLLDTLHNTLRQVLHIVGNLTFGRDVGNILIVPINFYGTIPNS